MTPSFHLVLGAWRAQVAAAIASLRIPDCLASGPRNHEDIANATGAHSGALKRLLEAAVAVGLLERIASNCYALTSIGQELRSNVPGSMRNYTMMLCSPGQWMAWAYLPNAIRENRSQTATALGVDLWTYYRAHPAEETVFNAAMQEISELTLDEALATLVLSDGDIVSDIGSGTGLLLCRLAEMHPNVECIAFDVEALRVAAEANIAASAASRRVRFVAGDFLEKITVVADWYILKNVLHNWSDDDCRRILKHCHDAAHRGSRLVIMEAVIDAAEGDYSRLLDLNMLVLLGGRQRTINDHRALLGDSGWIVESVVQQVGGMLRAITSSRS